MVLSVYTNYRYYTQEFSGNDFFFNRVQCGICQTSAPLPTNGINILEDLLSEKFVGKMFSFGVSCWSPFLKSIRVFSAVGLSIHGH